MSENKVAVIVGGGGGIGAACVRELASAGYRIAVMSPSGRGAALAKELGGVGIDGRNTSVDDLTVLVDLALAEYGRIDAVVNNSGHGARGAVLEISDEDWAAGMELYLLNVIRMARIVTPHLIQAGGGSIVNISTAFAYEPDAAYPVSATFRAGLGAFTKLYADEYGPRGIRINNVLPGWTKDDPASVPADWTTSIPLRRAQSTSELAKLVRFLAGDDASYITGQNIRADGGATRHI